VRAARWLGRNAFERAGTAVALAIALLGVWMAGEYGAGPATGIVTTIGWIVLLVAGRLSQGPDGADVMALGPKLAKVGTLLAVASAVLALVTATEIPGGAEVDMAISSPLYPAGILVGLVLMLAGVVLMLGRWFTKRG
jgi:hypothetical protein